MKVLPVISKILLGKNDFCRLCFNLVQEDAFRPQDEIILNLAHNTSTREVAEILNIVLGDRMKNLLNDLSPLDSICKKCIDAAKISYNFIKMCQENSECLSNSLDSLKDCLENVIEDLSSYKSIFVHISTKDFTSKQYYDNEDIAKNYETVIKRFHSFVSSKKKQNKKINAEGSKPKRTRIHNYGDEINKICEISREKNRSQFKCKECSAVFSKSFNFKKHYYSRHSTKTFTCAECGRSYGSEMLLKLHRNDSHASIMCSECGKTYKNRYSLLYHMRQHSGEHPYQCPHCDMKFQWSSRRAEHIRRYHLEPNVECDICHIKFRALGSLYDHRKRHFNPNSRLLVTQQTPPVAEETEII